MTRRLRFPDGSVETFGDDDEADFDFQMLAFAGREVAMTTEDGRPLALARNGRIEERDLLLAGTPVAVTTPTERFMSNLALERARSRFVLASYVPAASAEVMFDQAVSPGRLTARELRSVEEPSLESRPRIAWAFLASATVVAGLIIVAVQIAAKIAAGL